MAIAGLDGHLIDPNHVIRVSLKKQHHGNTTVPHHRIISMGNLSPHIAGCLSHPVGGLTSNMAGLPQNLACMPQTTGGYAPTMAGFSEHMGGLNQTVELPHDLVPGCYSNASPGMIEFHGLSASDVYRMTGYGGMQRLNEYTGGVAPYGMQVGMQGSPAGSYFGTGFANNANPLCSYTML